MAEEKPLSKVKITVLRCFKPEEVFKDLPVKAKYLNGNPCPLHEEGQIFYLEDDATGDRGPEGFCWYAWNAIMPYTMTLRHQGDFDEWYEEPGVCVLCCPDGLRPVVFKIERT